MQITQKMIEDAYKATLNQDIRPQDLSTITLFSKALFEQIKNNIAIQELNIFTFFDNALYKYQLQCLSHSNTNIPTEDVFESIHSKLRENNLYVKKLLAFTEEELLNEKVKLLEQNLETVKKLLIEKVYTPKDLEDIEIYRMQMAGICTAAFGHWKEGDSVHPDYMTPALKDVAGLYAKYNLLFNLCLDNKISIPFMEIGVTTIEMPTTVTKEYVESLCSDPDKISYIRFPGTLHTVCCISLPNGASIIGESVCAANVVFDEEKGRMYALENAKEKIYELEGYLLKDQRYKAGLNKKL